MNNDPRLQGDMSGEDPIPSSPDPLNPDRTEVDPMKEGGVDESTDNEGERPIDDDDVEMDPDRGREDTDAAITEKQQDAR
ncbi:hypothetical protein [Pseudomonas sp. NPDC096950]|uniref:hypothetical protein n=1 Tax=Pseudomonas sp. NPDC096950 TaxID=3364485 RepID=UPI00383A066F